jgi:hypothetical protein
MRVPHDFNNGIGRRQMKFSLKTDSVFSARQEALPLAGKDQQEFRWLMEG